MNGTVPAAQEGVLLLALYSDKVSVLPKDVDPCSGNGIDLPRPVIGHKAAALLLSTYGVCDPEIDRDGVISCVTDLGEDVVGEMIRRSVRNYPVTTASVLFADRTGFGGVTRTHAQSPTYKIEI